MTLKLAPNQTFDLPISEAVSLIKEALAIGKYFKLTPVYTYGRLTGINVAVSDRENEGIAVLEVTEPVKTVSPPDIVGEDKIEKGTDDTPKKAATKRKA